MQSRAHALRVVAVGLVKLRAFADGAIDPVGQFGRLEQIDVRFGRHREDPGWIRDRAEDRLAADDDELVLVGHIRTRADDVFELLASHVGACASGSPSTTPFRSFPIWSSTP